MKVSSVWSKSDRRSTNLRVGKHGSTITARQLRHLGAKGNYGGWLAVVASGRQRTQSRTIHGEEEKAARALAETSMNTLWHRTEKVGRLNVMKSLSKKSSQ